MGRRHTRCALVTGFRTFAVPIAALASCRAGSFRRDAADISQHVFRASDENIVNSVVWRDTGVSADGRIRNAFDPPGTWRRLRLQAVTGSAARAAVGHADDAGVPRSAGWHRNRATNGRAAGRESGGPHEEDWGVD